MKDMKSKNLRMKLEDLGFSDWFQERLRESPQLEYSLVRVIAVNKDNYIIRNEEEDIPAEVTGKLMYGAESNLDLPTVGDWFMCNTSMKALLPLSTGYFHNFLIEEFSPL